MVREYTSAHSSSITAFEGKTVGIKIAVLDLCEETRKLEKGIAL